MATKSELQDLLRFLTQDAKLPLKEALTKVAPLQKANLTNVNSISAAPVTVLSPILDSSPDSKIARQVLTAAKRITKKRSVSAISPTSPTTSSKRTKPTETSPSDLEASLFLPTYESTPESLQSVVVTTNRAPLLLAFAVVLLAYTHPHQPLSSRLSLAQGVVSVNSRAKAVSIALESGKNAEEEGWGMGQPRVKIMGREIRVLRRWGYEPVERKESKGSSHDVKDGAAALSSPEGTLLGDEQSQATLIDVQTTNNDSMGTNSGAEFPFLKEQPPPQTEANVPLWALDTEALRTSNTLKQSSSALIQPNLPIHTPQGARAYLLKSFSTFTDRTASASSGSKKQTAKEGAEERERNCGMVLAAIDALFASWVKIVSREELDRKAWGWYVAVRPEVESGQKGWGEKGRVELKNILELRRS